MKLITATIRPFRLDDVRLALRELGRIVTITEVKTYDPRPAAVHTYRGGESGSGFLPKVRIEVVVPETHIDIAIGIIRKAALTGHLGDGQICVTAVERLVRIRTGETGEKAL